MPTYNVRLNVNISAPDYESAKAQIPAYAKNHATISEGGQLDGERFVYILEKMGDTNTWEWDNVYDHDKGFTPEEILTTIIESDYGHEVTVDPTRFERTGNRWQHKDYDEYGVWIVKI